MSAGGSRLRNPIWNRRSTRRTEPAPAENTEASVLAYGTALASAAIDSRIVCYLYARAGIWCQDAEGEPIGVISWGENRTPSLQIAEADKLSGVPAGWEAELVVRCGMAAWRYLTEGRMLERGLPVRINPDLVPDAAPARQEATLAGR